MEIGTMTEEQLEEVTALGMECFSMPWCENGYREELRGRRSICLSAVEEGRIAGFLCASTVLDEADIGLIAVRKGFRRRGIAAALLDELAARCLARGVNILQLEVRAGNAAAIALYEGRGFQRVGLRKNFYLRPLEDAALYTAKLKSDFTDPA